MQPVCKLHTFAPSAANPSLSALCSPECPNAPASQPVDAKVVSRPKHSGTQNKVGALARPTSFFSRCPVPLPLALDFFSASSSPFSTGLLVSSSSFLSFPTLLGTSQKHDRFLPSNLWLRLCIYQCRRRYRLIDRREALLPERLWLQQRLGLGSTLLVQLYSFNCVCNDAFDSLRLDESRLGALTSGSCPLHHATCSVFARNTGPIRAWTDRCYRIQTSANPEIKVHSTEKTTWRPL